MGNSNLNMTLERIDTFIESQKEAMRLNEALTRLKSNKDFIDVIQHNYLDAEADRLFTILTNPSSGATYSDEQIRLKLEAIRHFKEYIGTPDFNGTIEINAEAAPLAIAREEDFRKAVTADGDS